MARPPLELETWGRIRRMTVKGKPTARAYYRDSDGVTRSMDRQGKTPAEAERNLVRALKQRLAPASDDLTADTTVSDLATRWLESRTRLAEGSVRIYQNAITKHISPGLGSVRLQECSVPRLDRFLVALARSSGPGTAKTTHVVLSGMFTLAARHGAVRANPMSDVPAPERAKRTARAAAPDRSAVQGILDRFEQWDAGSEPRNESDRRPRRARASDLADTANMFVGSGMRTGEVFALRWDALDLVTQRVIVRGTIAQDRDGKMFVQEVTKSDAGYRELELPAETVDMLVRRRVSSFSQFVFPSSVGTFRHPNNYRTTWRTALAGTPWAGVTPRSFRKTVATVVRDELGIEAARDQLGHEETKTTERSYADEIHRGPAVSLVLSKLLARTPAG
ncbi:integrase-like protein [Microbacterium sp. AG157]|uniref:site-specific integrase n=1 Tax=Microbacterium sp. AG157 TaxID=2183993 RepID=UPI000E27DC65|nr:tyrosine-type recombinase/integrase [Microbacterium sp. AG157]REC98374.1 integrase-like protein [Microbacterium sp. AG157]